MDKKYKVALILNDINWITDKDTASKHGGAGVVIRNLYLSLINDFNCQVDIYSKKISQFNYNKENTNEFIIQNIIKENCTEKLQEHLLKKNYDKIISMLKSPYFSGTILQTHTTKHRFNKVPALIKPFRFFKDKKKIKKQTTEFHKCSNSQKMIAVSDIVKQDYVKNCDVKPSNITVSYPGCEPHKYSLIKQNDCISFGIVANSSINKGGHLFLLALGISKIFKAKFRLHIIAPLYDKDILLKGLTSIFNLKKQITVYDKQKNMENFYKNIDCLVVPSKNETFGLVTLEAMSYGKTVLVSSSAGSSEIITYNNGFVFNRNSLSDFVQKIIKLSNIYSQDFKYFTELSKNSYKISKEYTWKNFTNKILENI